MDCRTYTWPYFSQDSRRWWQFCLKCRTVQYVVLGPRKSSMPLVRDFSENDKIFRREKKHVEKWKISCFTD